MKKFKILFVTVIALSISTQIFATNANTNLEIQNTTITTNKSFTFVEEGITFSIFQNGEFDFYINPRPGMHVGVDLNNVSISYNSGYNYDPYVQYDDYGAIIQIENTPIYYDNYGRIIRAGDVRINYQSNRVKRIGSLNIYYDAYGRYSYHRGYVNVFNRRHVFHPFHNFFVLPFFHRTVVSYKPYRNRYRPVRYNYYYGKNKHKRHYNKKYNRKRSFKNIDARIRTRNSNLARTNRTNRRATTVRESSEVRRQTAHRNTSNRTVTSSKRTVNNTPKRKVVQNRSRISPSKKVVRARTTVQNKVERKPVQRTSRTEARKTSSSSRRTVAQKSTPSRTKSTVSRTTSRKRM